MIYTNNNVFIVFSLIMLSRAAHQEVFFLSSRIPAPLLQECREKSRGFPIFRHHVNAPGRRGGGGHGPSGMSEPLPSAGIPLKNTLNLRRGWGSWGSRGIWGSWGNYGSWGSWGS